MVGGTSSALLSLFNSIDKDICSIDLILYSDTGPLMDLIPDHVNVLPIAYKYNPR